MWLGETITLHLYLTPQRSAGDHINYSSIRQLVPLSLLLSSPFLSSLPSSSCSNICFHTLSFLSCCLKEAEVSGVEVFMHTHTHTHKPLPNTGFWWIVKLMNTHVACIIYPTYFLCCSCTGQRTIILRLCVSNAHIQYLIFHYQSKSNYGWLNVKKQEFPCIQFTIQGWKPQKSNYALLNTVNNLHFL